ncbi:DUF1538 domain-containing protein [Helcococcus bovis]|uniref:DUF1538 domain-containing protein n=1 Tax=Helcococcus bovis TaxID=3153252 RepID=UPI0038B85326
MNLLFQKLKEISMTVLPIAFIVVIVNFTLIPLGDIIMKRFLIGTLLIIIGLTLFLIGVEIGVTPFGSKIGSTVARKNNIYFVVLVGLVLGFFISIAEPGLLVLGSQVESVTSGAISATTLFIVVSIGLAFMISVGFIRVFFNLSLRNILIVIYSIIFCLALFTSEEFLGISFDASGATTGVLAVPFILSLSTGVSKSKKDSIAGEADSFGLIALASSGAIIGVLLLDLFTKSNIVSDSLTIEKLKSESVLGPFIYIFPSQLSETVKSLSPLLLIYIVMQIFVFKLNKRENRKILTGFGFAFIGLLVFLTSVNGVFIEVGGLIGEGLASLDKSIWLIIISFIIGVVTILAEPAVYVLTRQIEDVTSGYVKKSALSISLALGVGLAISLSSLRIIIPELKLWHILLPGYILCFILSFYTPQLFVGIAFDAGGVATGPITATFILGFIQGAANITTTANLLIDGFGMIALVAMTPIIALQILGIIFKMKLNTNKRQDIKEISNAS